MKVVIERDGQSREVSGWRKWAIVIAAIAALALMMSVAILLVLGVTLTVALVLMIAVPLALVLALVQRIAVRHGAGD